MSTKAPWNFNAYRERIMETMFRSFSAPAMYVAIQTVRVATHEYEGASLATSVDWTMEEVVTPVNNQGQRGSSWALSTMGALEDAWAQSTGSLVSMSEQQLVDCDSTCSGGSGDTLQNTCGLGACSSYTPTSSCSSVTLRDDTCTDCICTRWSTFATASCDNADEVHYLVSASP